MTIKSNPFAASIQPSYTDSVWRWATVASVNPPQVQVDGSSAVSPISDSLIPIMHLYKGMRVYIHIYNRRISIIGHSSPLVKTSFSISANIPSDDWLSRASYPVGRSLPMHSLTTTLPREDQLQISRSTYAVRISPGLWNIDLAYLVRTNTQASDSFAALARVKATTMPYVIDPSSSYDIVPLLMNSGADIEPDLVGFTQVTTVIEPLESEDECYMIFIRGEGFVRSLYKADFTLIG